jgi:hypothetical protein
MSWDRVYPLLWVAVYVASFVVVPMAVATRYRGAHRARRGYRPSDVD